VTDGKGGFISQSQRAGFDPIAVGSCMATRL
jgi:hypothetical protein